MNSSVSDRIAVTMLLWLTPGGERALNTFREQAEPLWRKHDLRVERVLQGTAKGQLVGENPHDVPALIQVITLPSLDAFRAYVSDPEYVRLAAARDEGIARMVAVIGRPLDVSTLQPTSASAAGSRQYGVAFASFLADGEAGLDEFNRRASALYARHGMHVESMLKVLRVVTPVGEELVGFAPERVIVFFLDEASALGRYASDAEYRALAPIRDAGLRSYQFFLATVPAARR
jgi:uncharacterized protein (DUF1330 family)